MNFYDYTVPEKGEIFDTLLSHKNIKIVRIVSSDQVEEKVYCQSEDEWVIVIEGATLMEVDGKQKHLAKGDSLFIPAETPHRVLKTAEGTVWLTVHIF